MFSNSFSQFRLIAFMEGCSFLLFALTMPIKYILHFPTPNYIIGMLHGILFIVYLLLLLQVAFQQKWSFKKIALAFIAALIPFGTIYASKKLYPRQNN
jgi:integral membrane protein